MKRSKHALSWVLWGLVTLAAGAALGQKLVSKEASKQFFLPGKTTAGHYQIELECGACHTSGFTDTQEIQDACVGCHGSELEEGKDAHPQTKFTDPRNADRVKVLDARFCVTCHAEHLPEQTTSMGLSVPVDYCYECHQEIFQERPSHQGLPFDSCADTGCHNFHDNRALYEDYLVEHGRDAWLTASPVAARVPRPAGSATTRRLGRRDADLPGGGEPLTRWSESAHAAAGVNCSACHLGSSPPGEEQGTPAAPLDACGSCHDSALSGWLSGRHGMRVKQGLAPLSVGAARAPMAPEAAHRELTCSACHGDHGTERELARFEVCVSCHADEHTESYEGTAHHALLLLEREGRIATGGGVSCATCHLPAARGADGKVSVQHNQNANLRPREKMIRSVCQDCHGLSFALDALADAELVGRNFSGRPSVHVSSVDWALAREPSN